MFITELLDRIAIVECENNELEDKLKYFMSIQKASEIKVSTRDIGVGCDLPVRSEEPPYVAPFQPNHVSSAPRSSSRLSNSLLKYTPGQYSTMLRSTVVHTQETMTSTTQTAPPSTLHGQSRHEGSESESPVASEVSSSISPRARTSPSQVYTPFMRLMEMSAKMNIE